MGRYILLVDISGSMRCKLKKLKDMLADDWIPWRMGSPITNEVALISFSNDVCVNSHYTTDLASLQNMVRNLTLGGCGGYQTSLYDAIIVATVVESPKPNEIYIWSDLQDTNSDASQSAYVNLANSVGVTYNLCVPYEWMEDPNCYRVGILAPYPFKPVRFVQSAKFAKSLAQKMKMAKVIEKPEQFIEKHKK